MGIKETFQKIDNEEVKPIEKKKEEVVKKKRRGRPSVSHKVTKLSKILEQRGMTRRELYERILKKYPDEPISPDALSRIISGNRRHYSTTTLYRICGALSITPNMALDWEDEIYKQ
jgi:DNA-binding Xre family transcriptional regulator